MIGYDKEERKKKFKDKMIYFEEKIGIQKNEIEMVGENMKDMEKENEEGEGIEVGVI